MCRPLLGQTAICSRYGSVTSTANPPRVIFVSSRRGLLLEPRLEGPHHRKEPLPVVIAPLFHRARGPQGAQPPTRLGHQRRVVECFDDAPVLKSEFPDIAV